MSVYEVSMAQPYVVSDRKGKNAFSDFMKAKANFEEEHKLTPDNIAVEKDWRDMNEKEWNKLIDHFDKYMEDRRTELEKEKEVQEKAAERAAAIAPAFRKVLAAQSAALKASSGLYGETKSREDASELEKLSWTYEMETEDRSILAKAKAANEKAADALSGFQELALSGNTETGISISEIGAESAASEEYTDGKKKWTVTTYTREGIISCKTEDGIVIEKWTLKYKFSGDYRKVMDLISGFESTDNLIFTGNKNFWEDFLEGKISRENILRTNNGWIIE